MAGNLVAWFQNYTVKLQAAGLKQKSLKTVADTIRKGVYTQEDKCSTFKYIQKASITQDTTTQNFLSSQGPGQLAVG